METKTPTERLRAAAAQAELRGDWDQSELFGQAADLITSLQAANVAYRQALAHDIVININGSRVRSVFRNGKNSI